MAISLDRAMQVVDETIGLMRTCDEPYRGVGTAFSLLADRRQELIHSVDPPLSDAESQFVGEA